MKPAVPYSDAVARRICDALAEGESLRRLSLRPDMPCLSTVMRWLAEKPAFRRAYGIARVMQADRLAEEILAIADGREPQDVAVGAADETPPARGEAIQRAKLRVDTRKWLMARLAPKKYGDALLAGEIEAAGDGAEDGASGPARPRLLVQVVRYDQNDPTAE